MFQHPTTYLGFDIIEKIKSKTYSSHPLEELNQILNSHRPYCDFSKIELTASIGITKVKFHFTHIF